MGPAQYSPVPRPEVMPVMHDEHQLGGEIPPGEWPGYIPPAVGGPRPAGHRGRDKRLRALLVLVVLPALVGAAVAMGVARLSGWGRETVVNRYVQPNTSVIDRRPADIQGILYQVLPGVVSVTAISPASTPYFFSGQGAQVVASGTGVIITAAGEVVTNDHVVHGATSIRVTLNGSNTQLDATVVGESAADDLALLQIHGGSSFTPVTFGDSDRTVVGDDVLAVGYALGLSGGPSVTDGIISATGREVATRNSSGQSIALHDMLQTDAAISSGNSGGPLVDSAAHVIGINTVVATSSQSTTAQNIGFAIPAKTVEALLPQLRRG